MGSLTNSNATTVSSELDATKIATINGALQILDSAIAGELPITTTGGTTTLTGTPLSPQAQNMYLNLTGTLTSNAIVEIPVAAGTGRNRIYVVKNGTTGAFTVTVRKVGGTGVTVGQGKTRILLYNGSDIDYAAPEADAAVGASLRALASSSLTIYVNASSGSDSNNGLTSGTALATIQAAINLIKASYDLGGPRATPIIIQLADGTYSGGGNPVAMVSGPFVGQQPSGYSFPHANEVPISIRGNTGTPANVVLTSSSALGTVLTVWGGVIGVQDCKITNTGAGACLEAGGAAGIQFGNVILGACGGAKIQSEHGSIIENYSTFTVEGNCTNVIRAVHHSSVWLTGTMTIGASFTVTHFAIVRQSSEISVVSMTISLGANTVTGARFAIVDSSSINGTGSNVSFFPGTTAGTVDNGSYDGMRSIVGTVDWPTWTPTVTASSGSITTVGALDAAYWIDGKMVHFRLSITITTNGTGAGYVVATLPVTAKAKNFEYMARRVDTGNFIGATIVNSDTTHIYFATLTNTYPGADGAVLVATGTYEAA